MGTRRKEEKRKEEEGEEEGHPSQGSVQKEKGKGITLCEGDAKLFEHVLIAHVILPLNGGCEILNNTRPKMQEQQNEHRALADARALVHTWMRAHHRERERQQHTAHSTQHTAHSTQRTAHSTQHTAHTAHSTQHTHIGKWKIVFKDKRCVWIGLEVAKNSVISAERRKALVHSFLLVLVVMIK